MQVQEGAANDGRKRHRRMEEEHARVLRHLPNDIVENRIVNRKQMAALSGFSEDTLDALWAAGEGPGPRLRVTARHIGCFYPDFVAWLESRIEA